MPAPPTTPPPGPGGLVVVAGPDGTTGAVVSRQHAHQPPGVLHQAVSVQVVDPDGRWLLQQRAAGKAMFAGRWSNTCCTHPAPGEDLAQAAIRRTREELGLGLAGVTRAGTFTYRAVDPVSGLVEHEQDHVFVAVAPTRALTPAPDEIGAVVRLPFAAALALVASSRGTPWAPAVLRRAAEIIDGGLL